MWQMNRKNSKASKETDTTENIRKYRPTFVSYLNKIILFDH